MNDLFSLQGRTALITGGSRGIGRMIAAGFVAAGARVYISASKAEACNQTAKELSAFGHCVSLPADVSTQDGVQTLVAAYSQHEPALDILVNNAGAAWGAPYDEFPEKGWDKVAGLIHLTRRMALRLVQDNIVVNAIAPGAFASDMNRDARDHAAEVSAHIPAGRIGQDDDIA